tara:strand:- start:696 stop:1025 length:330 start_codon:yes stop_codon:yes gene_type:complete
MRLIIITLLFAASSAFAFDTNSRVSEDSLLCFETSKKSNLIHSRKKNLSTSKYINCLDKSKKIAKEKKVTTPDKKVNLGAAVILNPVGAAYWLINKAINTGVDKTINRQ